LEAVANHAPQARLLHISTALVYQASERPLNEQSTLGPDNPYALSKLVQDMMCHTFARSRQLDIVRVRPFNHIGERQAAGFVVTDLAKNIVAIERGQASELKVGNLDAVRDFSDVKDVVQGYILLMNKAESGSVYNLGSGTGYSIQQILQRLRTLATVEIPISIDQSKIRPVDLPQLICDNEKIAQLGYRVTHDIDETLARILEDWRAQD
jgi:GDP-4-dehydro-6-deoxy-D-mannose reductase